MVYARPKLPPTRYGATVLSIDDSRALLVTGYLRSIALEDPSDTVPGWVMVIAATYPAAIRAPELVQVTWRSGDTAAVSDQALQDRARALIADKSAGATLDTGGGNVEAAYASAITKVEATYTTEGVLHFPLEPVNALVLPKDGRYEMHAGNQAQSFILPVPAKAPQVSPENVVMRTYLIGGGYGRRLNGDYCVPAALAAKALQRPIKMVLTREDDSPSARRRCRRSGWGSTRRMRRSPWITPPSPDGPCSPSCRRVCSRARTAPSTIHTRLRAPTAGTRSASSRSGRPTTTPRHKFKHCNI